eukprot:CAMPEP_0116115800 /NCGR_PEP_ID=MMETSP0329-20121206/698_1 /TAXON_ID=697910 /ORGANISM="Pseudo-nitzschia arenysensis, Strain B593" /LENGTH=351 /DNA_ID=CAMNT_0003609253 /DNA_START=870 /DNA_END=1925 /DNA_ORIENTATION=+
MSNQEDYIETPEFQVGELYSEDFDWTSANFFQLHKRSLVAKADRKKKGRILQFGSPFTANRAFSKKLKMMMKWHPADKAREAQRKIAAFGIDPGIGYKIQVVMDESVDPPPMPRTPEQLTPLKNLNSVLMSGAANLAKSEKKKSVKKKSAKKRAVDSNKKKALDSDRTPPKASPRTQLFKQEADADDSLSNEKENEKENKDDDSSLVIVWPKRCLGCDRGTCLHTSTIEVAVAMANSMKDKEEVVMMDRDERVEWFLELFKSVDPNGHAIDCAQRYADRMMRYLTAEYLDRLGLDSEDDNSALEAENSSYVSSKYQEELTVFAAESASTGEEDEDEIPLAILVNPTAESVE